MSTKYIITILVGVIIIGGSIYFSMLPRTNNDMMSSTSISTTKSGEVLAPTKSASTDEIIDYIVDEQSKEETKTVQVILDASLTSPEQPTISTNF